MSNPQRIAFVIASSEHGAMIVNRLDHQINADGGVYGVGIELLERGAFNYDEVKSVANMLNGRRKHFGDGVVVVDCGANIGVHTVDWARHMKGWGSVIAIEAQERVFYALAGNIAINNCFNSKAINAAVSSTNGVMRIPCLDPLEYANFGGLELRRATEEYVGQEISYEDEATVEIRCMTVDSLGLNRVDLIKIDVEGMELDVLQGAEQTIDAAKPVIVAEYVKVGWDALAEPLTRRGYSLFRLDLNMVAIHESDPVLGYVSLST